MNIDRLKEELIADEGKKLEIYMCTVDKRTVAIGHMLTPVDPEWELNVGDTISEDRCDQLFFADTKMTINDCENVFSNWDDLPDEAQLICANMMFNMGRSRMNGFKQFIAALNEEPPNFSNAALEMKDSRWHEQLPNRSQRLIDRMAALGT